MKVYCVLKTYDGGWGATVLDKVFSEKEKAEFYVAKSRLLDEDVLWEIEEKKVK